MQEEKRLIVFTSFEQITIFLKCFQLEICHVREKNILETSEYVLSLNFIANESFDMCIFIHKLPLQFPIEDNWFLVNNVSDFLSCLQKRLENSSKNKLNQIFVTTKQQPQIKKEEENGGKVVKIKQKSSKNCISCVENKSCVMYDCGHASFCEGCSKKWSKTCPICRKMVEKIYILNKK